MSQIIPSVRCKPLTRTEFWEELAKLFLANAYSHLIQVRYMGPMTGLDSETGLGVGIQFYNYQVAITTHPAPTVPDDRAELTTTRYYAVWINAPKGE